MKIISDIKPLPEKYVIVKKTKTGYLYYRNYSNVGTRYYSQSSIYNKADAEAKLKSLHLNTKGRFHIMSATEMYVNDWKFSVEIPYNETEYHIKVSNSFKHIDDVKAYGRVSQYREALEGLNTSIANNKARITDSIKWQTQKIADIYAAIKVEEEKLKKLEEASTISAQEQLQKIVEENSTTQDRVVSVLYANRKV